MDILNLNVYDELSFSMRLREVDEKYIKIKVNELLETFNLNKVANSQVVNLSGGELQRLALATLFIEKRDFIILDEPTKSLDKENRLRLFNHLKNIHKDNTGVIMISHYEEALSMATRVITLDKGGIIIENRPKS